MQYLVYIFINARAPETSRFRYVARAANERESEYIDSELDDLKKKKTPHFVYKQRFDSMEEAKSFASTISIDDIKSILFK